MSASKSGETKIQVTSSDDKSYEQLAREQHDRAALAKQTESMPAPGGDIGPLYHSRHNYPTA